MTSQFAYFLPELNSSDSVAVALRAVSNARDKESSQYAYNKLLSSVGNNHSGTYSPIVLSVVSEIEPILRSGEIWPQYTVIEALIDLFVSFVLAPGEEIFCDRSLSVALRERIIGLKWYFVLIASGTGAAATSAEHILKHLNEQAEQGVDGIA
jgi:hypothetical protein